MRKLIFIALSFYLILESNFLHAQNSAKTTGRIDLRKFKTNSSDILKKETTIDILKKETTILEGEIIGTSSYVDLSLEILPESYAFENEPIVYNDKGLQTKVVNGDEEFLMKFKIGAQYRAHAHSQYKCSMMMKNKIKLRLSLSEINSTWYIYLGCLLHN